MKKTFDEMLRSLNGFDEIAVEQRFGAEILDLIDRSATKAARALLFVQSRRDGMDDAAAWSHVQGLTVGQVNDAFDDEPDEVMPEEPLTPLDGGSPVAEPATETSPPSVSLPESPLPSTPL